MLGPMVYSFENTLREALWISKFQQESPAWLVVSCDPIFQHYADSLAQPINWILWDQGLDPHTPMLLQGANRQNWPSTSEILSRLQQHKAPIIFTRARQQNNVNCEVWPLLLQLSSEEQSIYSHTPPHAICSPPIPQPPLKARPRTFTPTSLELLIRNPYAYYCRYILGLKAKEGKKPLHSMFGVALHNIIASVQSSTIKDYQQFKQLYHSHCDEVLGRVELKPYQSSWAKRRLRNLQSNLYQFLTEWQQGVERTVVEGSGGRILILKDGGAVTISARSDRIDYFSDDTIRITDFKTSTSPTKAEVESGLFPQLPLEAIITGNLNAKLFYIEAIGRLDKFSKNSISCILEETYISLVCLLEMFLLDQKNAYFVNSFLDAKTKIYKHISRDALCLTT